ncbi:Predicted arabinose efflux permease, MFS family [Pseudomonas sp. NFACC23-1]|uniref:MFS transporter n=1 Tax=unclassified Pseudomonas TaxID=196821 RepID=UPI0008804D5F|nr:MULTISPECIES: MFS transporter [unclassified Pseudomonas]SDB03067.1 Predicted arabinose efflux permease, MFS family [Pseudomonas sp. NFACC17-2]SEI82590.1 Predicted arabinose efflux permease, MFS family [Pseudomonas sp. NFACC23-1]SFW21978.1 Predicted arabinose efflux permease, MFS family [Pseudomonas sp. NFACC16-2]
MNALDSIDSKKSLGAICLMMVISLGTLQIQPILGGALIDQLGLPLNAIGALFAAELMAMAIACGVCALFMASVDRRRFALVALLILALGNLASTQLHSQAGLVISRMICGASGGAVMAVVYATAALRTSKDATFAVINIGNLLWGMLLVTSMPRVLQAFGVNGAFSLLAITSVLAALGCWRVPKRYPDAHRAANGSIQPFGLTAMLLILLFALLFFGHSALWVYQERIGKSIGLEPQQIGGILGGSILAGALGAALAGLIGRRLGLLFPQLLSFGTALLATLIMVYGTSPVAFITTACLIHMVWFFSLPYLLSMAAELDPSGRLAGLGNAAIFIGQGLGPFGAALVVGEGHLRAVGWLAASAYLLALVISCLVVARFRRGVKPSGPAMSPQSA